MGRNSLEDRGGEREEVGNERYRALGTWEMGIQERNKQTTLEFCSEHVK